MKKKFISNEPERVLGEGEHIKQIFYILIKTQGIAPNVSLCCTQNSKRRL